MQVFVIKISVALGLLGVGFGIGMGSTILVLGLCQAAGRRLQRPKGKHPWEVGNA